MTTAQEMVDEVLGGKSVPFVIRRRTGPTRYEYRAVCLRCTGFCCGLRANWSKYTWVTKEPAQRAAQRHARAHQEYDDWYAEHPAWPPAKLYGTKSIGFGPRGWMDALSGWEKVPE